jgi:hypothetical protein
MDSLTFVPGRAFLSSDSPAVPWTVVFEDEGAAGYFYACDRSHTTLEDSILDAMLIYHVGTPLTSTSGDERLAAIQWSRDGLQAVLYLDGVPQALADFGARRGYCRMNFPNFAPDQSDIWNRSDHSWSDAALESFEAALYT